MAFGGLSLNALVCLIAALTLSIGSVALMISLLSADDFPTGRDVAFESYRVQHFPSSSNNAVANRGAAIGIGISGLHWNAMGVELEMQPKPGLNISLSDAGELAKAALLQESCAAAGHCTKSREAELQAVHIHEHEKILTAPPTYWTLHEESDPGPLYELVSPWLLEELEASLAVQVSSHLSQNFGGGRFAALHVHVDGRCLLKQGGAAVASLLLLWETFHVALAAVVSHRPSAMTYGPSLGQKHPRLLAALQEFWSVEQKPIDEASGHGSKEDSIMRLVDLFELHHDAMFEHREKGVLAGIPNRNGYRNFAVNICHLLDVRCCRRCNKNMAPKHGLVEFRIFDVVYGQKLYALLQLAQRMVQLLCCEPSDGNWKACKREHIERNLLIRGREPSTDLSALLDLLEVDKDRFHSLFVEHLKSTS